MTHSLHDVEPHRQVGVRATQLPLANYEILKNYQTSMHMFAHVEN